MLRHGPLGHPKPEQTATNNGNSDLTYDNAKEYQNAPPLPSGPDVQSYFPSPPISESQPPANYPMTTTLSPRSSPPMFLGVKDTQSSLSEAPSEEDSSFQNDDTLDDEETFVYEKYQLRELSSSVIDAILSHQDLRKLSLKGNQLSALPIKLKNLPCLYYLNLSHNNFGVVPDVVCELHNLEILDLSHNSLTYLPQSLINLRQLMGLSLVSNNFEVLPPVIADLHKLEILELDDNPIRVPHVLPEVNSSDEEAWLIQIKKLIERFKPVLENALANDANNGSRRSVPERSRSASESGVSLRAAKRMGFVMSRNATDQLYVANLHARGMSHDVHMLDSISSAPPGGVSSGVSSGGPSSGAPPGGVPSGGISSGVPTSGLANGPASAGPVHSDGFSNTISSLGTSSANGSATSLSSAQPVSAQSSVQSATAIQSQSQQLPAKPVTGGPLHSLITTTPAPVHASDAEMPTPRSPISVSPNMSPRVSPRASYDGAIDIQSTGSSSVPPGSGRLGTLAEEHDIEAYSDNAESPLEASDTRPSQMSTPISPTFPHHSNVAAASRTGSQTTIPDDMHGTGRKASSAMPPLRETSPHARGSATTNAPEHTVNSPATAVNPASLFRESSLRQAASRSESPRSDPQRPTGVNVQRSGSIGPSAPFPQAPLTPSSVLNSNSTSGNSFTNSPAVDIPVENISFALKEFGSTLSHLVFAFPPHLTNSFLSAQAAVAGEQWVDALMAYSELLDKLTVPGTFSEIAAQLSRRQQRQLASSIVLTFPELESAWRQIQQSSVMPLSVSSTQPQAQDDQLHSQLDMATKRAQNVLSLLNAVVAKSAAVAASAYSTTPGSNTTLASTMVSRVRDLSAVCLRCNNSIRGIRALLDQQPSMHTRIRQLGERRRFWDEVNGFLKAVVATLAAVKSALPDMPLLANNKVSTDVADLTRIVKEIPPLLEQSSYRLLLESGGPHSAPADTEDMYIHPAVMHQAAHNTSTNNLASSTPGGSSQLQAQMMLNSQSQISLPPPTPLTASLGAAAQALVSPNERVERPSEGYIQYGLRYKADNQ